MNEGMKKSIEKFRKKLAKKKKKNNEKTVKTIQKMIMSFGDSLLPIYIGITSFMIAYMWILIFYNSHRDLFLNYLNDTSGGVLIADLFFMGLILAIIWGTLGLFCVFMYKHHYKLKAAGFKKNKSLFEQAVDVKGKK